MQGVRYYILISLMGIFVMSCSIRKGYLDAPSPANGVGIIKFVIEDGDGRDISNKCAVGYGDDGISPNLKLGKVVPHYIELDKAFKVKYIHCLINLRLYRYNFKDFSFVINNTNAYNFGEYHLRYDYLKNYTNTKFYKSALSKYRSGELENYPEDNLSEGHMISLSWRELPFSLVKKFPKSNKIEKKIHKLLPFNVLK